MRVVAKTQPTIKDDPKTILERSVWQRLRLAAIEEVLHPDWGIALYSLHRAGRINNDQRDAGDRYARLIADYRALWRDSMLNFQVDDRGEMTELVRFGLGHIASEGAGDSEFETKRAKSIGKRYRDARALVGRVNRAIEDLLMEGVWPAGEIEQREISYALTRLSHFFATGTKRKR